MDAQYGRLTGTWAYETPEAGTIVLDGTSEWADAIGLTTHGIALGPVELSPYTGTTAVVTDLSFGPADDSFFDGWTDPSDGNGNSTDGDGWFASGALAALVGDHARVDAADDDTTPHMTRRSLLQSAGVALLAGGAAARTVRAQSDQVQVARFELAENPGGVRVRVRDLAQDLLPTKAVYYALIDEMDYAEFRGGTRQSGDIPPFPDGEARTVELTTSAGSIIGTINETLGRKALTYSVKLPQPAADYPDGELVPVTTHPLIVEATLRAGADGLTFELGGEAIPHRTEERSNPVGHFAVRNGDVMYRVGRDAPAATGGEFTVYAGTIEELRDDIDQEF